MTDPDHPWGRADAQNNRARILEVAHELLTESSDASLNSIAKAAGVGPGTLYRNFPNRESLVLAVYRRDVQRLVDAAPDMLVGRTPIEAVKAWFERLTVYLRLKHGLGDALDAATKQAMTNENAGPVNAAVDLLLDAGKADGTIRADLLAGDVVMAMSCLWRTPDTPDGNEQAARLLDIIARGLRP